MNNESKRSSLLHLAQIGIQLEYVLITRVITWQYLA
jgi:hypothetical protein